MFGWLDWTIFGVYMAASAGIGLFFTFSNKTQEDYLLAGRSMGFIPVGISVAASFLSGITYLGGPAEVYEHDMSMYILTLSLLIATPTCIFLFQPFFHGMHLTSAYEYFEARYGGAFLRFLASFFFILRVVLYLSVATYAPALALSVVADIDIWITIVATSGLSMLYTSLGGMKAVIWTDVFQFCVLFGGIFVIVGTAITRVPGSFAGMWKIAEENHKLTMFHWTVDPTYQRGAFAIFFGGAVQGLVQLATDQVSVQRYMTAKSLKSAQQGLWLKLIVLMPLTLTILFSGVVLFTFYKVHGDPVVEKHVPVNAILPYFVATELPMGFAGLLIAALYGTTMSTTSSGLSSLTTATMIDFVGKFKLYYHQHKYRARRAAGAKDEDDDADSDDDLDNERTLLNNKNSNEKKVSAAEKQVLFVSRLVTLAYGIVVGASAFLVSKLGNLLDLTVKLLGLAGGPLLGLFLLGMVTRSANQVSAAIGFVIGTIFMVFLLVGQYACSPHSTGVCLYLYDYSLLSFNVWGLLGTVITFVVGWLLSFVLGRKPTLEQLDGLSLNKSKAFFRLANRLKLTKSARPPSQHIQQDF